MTDGDAKTAPGSELLLDLVALFNTEAAHADAETERMRLANEAKAIAELALQTSATPPRKS